MKLAASAREQLAVAQEQKAAAVQQLQDAKEVVVAQQAALHERSQQVGRLEQEVLSTRESAYAAHRALYSTCHMMRSMLCSPCHWRCRMKRAAP